LALLHKDHVLHSARIAGVPQYTGRVLNFRCTFPSHQCDRKKLRGTVVAPISAEESSSTPARGGGGDMYCNMHRAQFDSRGEAVALLLSVAGDLYEKIDLSKSIRTYNILASYTMQIAGIAPFQLDSAQQQHPVTGTGITEEVASVTELAEKASESWCKVSFLASKQLDETEHQHQQKRLQQEEDRMHWSRYKLLQVSMLALYNAGVCAFHCDTEQAQRALESAECRRKEIDALLAGPLLQDFNYQSAAPLHPPLATATATATTTATAPFATTATTPATGTTTGPSTSSSNRNSAGGKDDDSDNNNSLHGYYAACGDLSYHLGQAYLRQAKYSECVTAATEAHDYYQHAERLLFTLRAMQQQQHGPKSLCSGSSSTGESAKSRDCSSTGLSSQMLPHKSAAGCDLVVPISEQTAMGRLRQRQSLGLLALAFSALGELAKSDRLVRSVADLCLGPIEGIYLETYLYVVVALVFGWLLRHMLKAAT
jgi:hypothetical protein